MMNQNYIIGMLLCAVWACSNETPSKVTSQEPQAAKRTSLSTLLPTLKPNAAFASPHGSPPSKAVHASQTNQIQGKVVETMNSGGYTYVSIQTASGETVWAAGRPVRIQVGDLVSIKKEMEMTNFTSKTLERTFKSIYFVTSFKVQSANQTRPTAKSRFPSLTPPSAQPRFPTLPLPGAKIPSSNPHASPQANPHANPQAKSHTYEKKTHSSSSPTPSTSPAQSKKISVAKAKGGYSIAEIFAQSRALAGKEVRVQGKVVKFNSGIMGKNWVHIQDGTGDPTKKTHDLTVTCDQTVSVGDFVLVKGKIALDLDIGAGYQYPVLVEQATLTAFAPTSL